MDKLKILITRFVLLVIAVIMTIVAFYALIVIGFIACVCTVYVALRELHAHNKDSKGR